MRIAVVGGGITGLAAAHRIEELDGCAEITLFESSSRLGGVLRTEVEAGFLLENSADMFTTSDRAALDLCERIGFDNELIPTNPAQRRALIAQGDQLLPVPSGFNLMSPTDLSAVEASPLLSELGKSRLLKERAIPPRRESGDESLFDFATRRFGDEVYERIIQPLVGGIYTADPKKLSLDATLPQYREMERAHGSILAALEHRVETRSNDAELTSGARYNLFLAPKRGMESMVHALSERLQRTEIGFGSRVGTIEWKNGTWQLTVSSPRTERAVQLEFDAVLIATSARVGGRLLSGISPTIGTLLDEIAYASSAIVVQGYAIDQIEHPLDAFGFVVPLVESRNLLACSFTSNKFPGRAQQGNVLLRSFVGGGCQPHLLDHDDRELIRLVNHDLHELIGVRGQPAIQKVVRWEQSMPQYHVGHLNRVGQIEAELDRLPPRLAIAGKSYRGVGIPACIASGEAAAVRLLG